MKRWKFGIILKLIFALGIAITAGWFAWFRYYGALTVETSSVFRGELIKAVYATGIVVSEHEVCVSSTISGKIVEILVDEGDEVETGQVLVRLDDVKARLNLKDAENRFHRAEIDLRQSKVELQRQEQLRSKQAGIGQSYDNAGVSLDLAATILEEQRVARELAARKLSDHSLSAPFSGTVVRRLASPGDMIGQEKCILSLVDNKNLSIMAEVDERDIARISPGLPVIAAFDAIPSLRVDGRVATIIPLTDKVTKTIKVKITLDKAPPILQTGMTVTINIIDEKRPGVLLVASSALLKKEGSQAVITINHGRAAVLPIQIGLDDGKNAEVLSTSLPEGTRVVLHPAATIRENRRLTVR
jgi:membrane fusion protein, multidrug efflux system